MDQSSELPSFNPDTAETVVMIKERPAEVTTSIKALKDDMKEALKKEHLLTAQAELIIGNLEIFMDNKTMNDHVKKFYPHSRIRKFFSGDNTIQDKDHTGKVFVDINNPAIYLNLEPLESQFSVEIYEKPLEIQERALMYMCNQEWAFQRDMLLTNLVPGYKGTIENHPTQQVQMIPIGKGVFMPLIHNQNNLSVPSKEQKPLFVAKL